MLVLRMTPRSPFARKCLILAHEKSMIDQLDLKSTDLYGQNQDIDNDNPLRKVPALRLEDGTTLFDSTVICEFLDCVDGDPKFHPQEGHARFAALRLQALGDGLTEAPQSLYKEMARPEKYRLAEMVEKFDSAIGRILSWIEANADVLDGPLTIGGIALTCGLGYVDERRPDMGWRDDHPKLGDWYKAICERPSFINTTKEVNAERLGVPVP
jgi:glutathione S-transferase